MKEAEKMEEKKWEDTDKGTEKLRLNKEPEFYPYVEEFLKSEAFGCFKTKKSWDIFCRHRRCRRSERSRRRCAWRH